MGKLNIHPAIPGTSGKIKLHPINPNPSGDIQVNEAINAAACDQLTEDVIGDGDVLQTIASVTIAPTVASQLMSIGTYSVSNIDQAGLLLPGFTIWVDDVQVAGAREEVQITSSGSVSACTTVSPGSHTVELRYIGGGTQIFAASSPDNNHATLSVVAASV